MNKKIISIFFLLIVMVSIASAYVYFNQNETNENQYESSGKNINNEDVANEIDDLFIDENDEVEIGEMV
jgi:CHASE3 domain sensor protein